MIAVGSQEVHLHGMGISIVIDGREDRTFGSADHPSEFVIVGFHISRYGRVDHRHLNRRPHPIQTYNHLLDRHLLDDETARETGHLKIQWCRGRDLNPRTTKDRILNPAPFPDSATPATTLGMGRGLICYRSDPSNQASSEESL